jgi:hypothetical protein
MLLLPILTRFSVHHDNRDFGILPNYQPQWQATFFSQTELFHESQGVRETLTCSNRFTD